MNNVFFNWCSHLTGWAHASVWLTAMVPKEKWMWVFIWDCLLFVTTLPALAHKAGDKNKTLESHTTLLGKSEPKNGHLPIPGPSSSRLVRTPRSGAQHRLPRGTWLCPRFLLELQSWEQKGWKVACNGQASVSAPCISNARSLLFSHSLCSFLVSALG